MKNTKKKKNIKNYKKTTKKYGGSGENSSNIITIDVGGKIFRISRDKLTTHSEYFQKVLSEQWKPYSRFEDLDPTGFKYVLSFIRYFDIPDDEGEGIIKKFQVPDEYTLAITRHVADYLGVYNLVNYIDNTNVNDLVYSVKDNSSPSQWESDISTKLSVVLNHLRHTSERDGDPNLPPGSFETICSPHRGEFIVDPSILAPPPRIRWSRA